MKNNSSFLFLATVLMVVALGTTGNVFHPAGAEEKETPFFEAEASPVDEKVCPNREVTMLYKLTFHGLDYEKDQKRNGAVPFPSLTHPTIKVTATNGTVRGVKDLAVTYEGEPPYDDVFKFWSDTFYFTPKKPGTATVNFEARYLGMIARTKWTITVWEDCKYTVEISSDESNFKMPSGKTFNEEQSWWQGILYYAGRAKNVLAEPLMQEGGGGQQRLFSGWSPAGFRQDEAQGSLEFFADAIWLGNAEDTTCGTDGALTCTDSFTVRGVTAEETITFDIDVLGGQCSGYHIWCRGDNGGGDANIPPMASDGFSMSVDIPVEGGSARFVRPLPHGTSIEYLVTAYPEVEE